MKKNKNIRKTFLWSDMIVILAVILAGVAFLPFGLGWQELGYSIIVCGLCMAPLYMHGYKIVGESGVFQEECILVSRKDRESIFYFLAENLLLLIFINKSKEVHWFHSFIRKIRKCIMPNILIMHKSWKEKPSLLSKFHPSNMKH